MRFSFLTAKTYTHTFWQFISLSVLLMTILKASLSSMIIIRTLMVSVVVPFVITLREAMVTRVGVVVATSPLTPPRRVIVTIGVMVGMPFVISLRGAMVTIGVTTTLQAPVLGMRTTGMSFITPPRGSMVMVAVVPTKRTWCK